MVKVVNHIPYLKNIHLGFLHWQTPLSNDYNDALQQVTSLHRQVSDILDLLYLITQVLISLNFEKHISPLSHAVLAKFVNQYQHLV